MVAKNSTRRFQELSEPRKRLIRLMQCINFGRISFHVRRGEPDVDRSWRTRRTVKLGGGENRPRPEAELADFEFCREQAALLDTLDHIADGACVTVEVRHGVPFLVEIEQDHQAA